MSDVGLRKHIAIPVQYNELYFARWSFADGKNMFHCYREFYPHIIRSKYSRLLGDLHLQSNVY